jgi:hypothetical protein
LTEDEYQRVKRFDATELGAMWKKYHFAMIDYWSADGQDDISAADLKKLDKALKEASEPFHAKLMELAGVK